MKLGIVLPTVDGRQDDLVRCVRAYVERTPASIEFFVYPEKGNLGEFWQRGAEEAIQWGADYLLLSVDDFLPEPGWTTDALQIADSGRIPACRVRNPDGYIHVWGGVDIADGTQAGKNPAECAALPFCTVTQWQEIGPMIPLHYCTDWWFGHRARLAGFPTVACSSMNFRHLDAQAGREDAQDKLARDMEIYFAAAS